MGAHVAPHGQAATSFLRCQVCTALLSSTDKHRAVGVCDDCSGRPEARRFLEPKAAAAKPAAAPGTPAAPMKVAPAPFTAAEKSLIAATGAHLPADELLKILNDRLVADRGSDVVLHTLEQLRQEVGSHRAGGTDAGWGAQRRRLARARRDGVLDLITAQVIDDFATCFQLTTTQVTHLREAIASAQEE